MTPLIRSSRHWRHARTLPALIAASSLGLLLAACPAHQPRPLPGGPSPEYEPPRDYDAPGIDGPGLPETPPTPPPIAPLPAPPLDGPPGPSSAPVPSAAVLPPPPPGTAPPPSAAPAVSPFSTPGKASPIGTALSPPPIENQ